MTTLPVSRLPAGWVPAADTLADRVVLVTGAYGGLGGAVARAASRTGATVVVTGHVLTGVMSHCMQGQPFQVTSARRG